MSNPPLNDEQQELREMVGRLADDVYGPKAQDWDREFTFLPRPTAGGSPISACSASACRPSSAAAASSSTAP